MAVTIPVERRTRLRFLLCFWLFVLSSISFVDRTNISIAGVQLSHAFGLSNQRLGWIFSAFLVGYASFQIPAGVLAVRFGPRRVLAVGVSIWAVCNIATALLPSGFSQAIVLLLAVRCMLGISEAVLYPSATQFVARWVPQKERGRINGLIWAGVGAGSGLTPPLLTWLILSFGWRAAFWFDAGLGLIGASVWWLIARDRPDQHPRASAAECREIQEGLMALSMAIPQTPGAVASQAKNPAIPWRLIFSRIDLLALMMSYFSYGYASWIFFSWFYLYMTEARGVNLKTSALFTMMPFLCMTLFCFCGGLVSDRLSRTVSLRVGRCTLATVAMSCTAVLLLVGSRVHDPLSAAILLALGAGCLYFSQSSFWSVATDIAGPNSGVFSAIVNMSCQIGAAITTSLTPWLALHFNWKMPFTVAAVLVFGGAMAWTLVHPERVLEPVINAEA